MLNTTTSIVGRVTIVDCEGRITLGDGSKTLECLTRDLIQKGHRRILLNLADVTYVDNSGIGELVVAFAAVRNAGGELKLLHLTKKVHDLLTVTKLYTIFSVYDDEQRAIASFQV